MQPFIFATPKQVDKILTHEIMDPSKNPELCLEVGKIKDLPQDVWTKIFEYLLVIKQGPIQENEPDKDILYPWLKTTSFFTADQNICKILTGVQELSKHSHSTVESLVRSIVKGKMENKIAELQESSLGPSPSVCVKNEYLCCILGWCWTLIIFECL
jgi:hypothetical protein